MSKTFLLFNSCSNQLFFYYIKYIFYLSFFLFLEVERNHVKSLQHREEVAAVSYELDKEKHILRQLQGKVFHI